MNRATRLIRALGGGGALLWAAMAAAVPAHASATAYSPPASELLLTRTLQRPLADGKQVVTRRSYEVRIVRDGGGYRVDGILVDCQVDVPPSLHMLAEIERNRRDDGLFPIRLDADGMIIDKMQDASAQAIETATSVGAEQIGVSPLSRADKQQAMGFLSQLQSQSGRTSWPADTFHPRSGVRTDQRELVLPGGAGGFVTITIESGRGMALGELSSLRREVTTDIGGDKRTTLEEWTLRRLAALER